MFSFIIIPDIIVAPRNYFAHHNKIIYGSKLFVVWFSRRTKRKCRCNRYNEDSQWQYLGWNLGRNADHTNIENTYPLDITPEPKDSEEGAHTGVNKRSRRKEGHDDDSMRCDGGVGGGDEGGGA